MQSIINSIIKNRNLIIYIILSLVTFNSLYKTSSVHYNGIGKIGTYLSGKSSFFSSFIYSYFDLKDKNQRLIDENFELKKGLEGGMEFLNRLQMCVRAVSLGTCDTLLSHPASTTHVGVLREERMKYGITDGLIRMSVGMESIEDILQDLEQALATQ